MALFRRDREKEEFTSAKGDAGKRQSSSRASSHPAEKKHGRVVDLRALAEVGGKKNADSARSKKPNISAEQKKERRQDLEDFFRSTEDDAPKGRKSVFQQEFQGVRGIGAALQGLQETIQGARKSKQERSTGSRKSQKDTVQKDRSHRSLTKTRSTKKARAQKKHDEQRAAIPVISKPLTHHIQNRRTKPGVFTFLKTGFGKMYIAVQHGFDLFVSLFIRRLGLATKQQESVRPIIAFGLVLCVLLIPVCAIAVVSSVHKKERVLTESANEAFIHLQAGGAALAAGDYTEAENAFISARKEFEQLRGHVDGISGAAISIARHLPGLQKGKEAGAGKDVILAGNNLSAAAIQISRVAQHASTLSSDIAGNPQQIIEALELIQRDLQPAGKNVHEARVIIDDISAADIPADKRAFFAIVQQNIPLADDLLQQAIDLSEATSILLGSKGEGRYLLLFQNNRELRPTGGFIGSFAVVSVQDGFVKEFEAPGGGIYDLAGQFTEKPISPQALHLVNPHWSIQDANWFPHFPDSAKKVQWFYERSGGSTVDGVITLTPDVIEKLLEVTGSIEVAVNNGGEDESAETITVNSENVYDLLQARDETDPEAVEQPKRLIGAIAPAVLNATITAAHDPANALQIVGAFKQALDEKAILVQMNDESLQQIFTKHDWIGAVKTTDKDYLYVNHANIAGGKTDAVMDEVIQHRAEIQEDGSIIDTVEITRQHTGRADHELESVMNVSFVRVYVPEGSELISAEGFDMPLPNQFIPPDTDAKPDADYQRISGDVLLNDSTRVYTNTEYEKTVFGGWMRTRVGESTRVTLKYKLPFTVEVGRFWKQIDSYSLLVQKQPGQKTPVLSSQIVLPSTLTARSWYPGSIEEALSGGEESSQLLTSDVQQGVVIERSR